MRGLCGSYAGRLCGRFVQEVYAGFMRVYAGLCGGLCGRFMRGSLRRFMRGLCGEVREASTDRCGEEVYAGGLCGVYAELYLGTFMRRFMR